MIVLGIDPGVAGAVAFFDTALPDHVEAFDIPTVNGVIDGRNLLAVIRRRSVDRVVIEDVHSMPKQGVASTFKFGRAFGTLIGLVEALGLPLNFVPPSKWKKAAGLDGTAERSRQVALNTFPCSADLFARKKDHNRAEAALLARWAGQTLAGVAA